MQHDELIGYSRIDSEADQDVLESWVTRLLELGVHEVFTDVGPLQNGLAGLQGAVTSLKIEGALIYPEVCLRELTVGDIPNIFGHVPDGTAITFFEPLTIGNQNGSVGMSLIKLVVAADGDSYG